MTVTLTFTKALPPVSWLSVLSSICGGLGYRCEGETVLTRAKWLLQFTQFILDFLNVLQFNNSFYWDQVLLMMPLSKDQLFQIILLFLFCSRLLWFVEVELLFFPSSSQHQRRIQEGNKMSLCIYQKPGEKKYRNEGVSIELI